MINQDFLVIVFLFSLGAIVGSFLNVVILRFNTGRSFVSGRSGCFSCGKKIAWYENIPLVSFLFLKGKCSNCKSKISLQYPLVEFATGLVFSLGFLKYAHVLNESLSSFFISYLLLILISIFLILIFIYDLRHKIIPNEFVYPFVALSAVYMFFPSGVYVFPSLTHILAGPLLFLPFFTLWLVSQGRWIGFADGKFAWGMGWALGLVYGLSAVVLGFWIGALWALGGLLLQKIGLFTYSKGITMKSEVPFGPFLIIALLIIFMFPLDFFNLANLFEYYAIPF
mgnify:CR=1 FL=1